MVHLPGCTKATIEGPMLSFPCPKTLLVAVGKTNTGPAPQINLFGLVAKMKKVGVMSPNPNTPAFCCTFWAAQYAGVSSSMPNTSRFAVPGGRLRDYWGDPTDNQIPVLTDLDRDNGLDVQHILRPIKGTYPKVTVVLDWNTNEPGHWALDSLLQTCCSISHVWCGL